MEVRNRPTLFFAMRAKSRASEILTGSWKKNAELVFFKKKIPFASIDRA